MELTDIHNRRDNITVVANDCKANHYPLIAWPEDKELLRLADLPRFVRANKRPNWTRLESNRARIIVSDRDLREFVTEGFAYSINNGPQQFSHSFVVQEWSLSTR